MADIIEFQPRKPVANSPDDLRRPVRRSIVVEPAPKGLGVWRLYSWDGSYGGSRSETAARGEVIAFAQKISREIGLPAFYRGNLHPSPAPMHRKDQF